MTPYKIWLVTIPIFIWSILLIPTARIITIPLFIIHQFILVLGINNLRINFFHKSYWHGNKKDKRIALTFDDGPDNQLTPDILDLLDKYNFKATFFIIAQKAEQHPKIVNEIINRGHTIGSHDLHHSFLSNFRMEKTIKKDLSKSLDLLQNICGKRIRLYRPPIGLSNPNYRKVLKELDLECISWSVKPYDAGNRRLGGIKSINLKPKNGDIILLHDALPNAQYKNFILDSMESLFKYINNSGHLPVTIDNILNIKPYQ